MSDAQFKTLLKREVVFIQWRRGHIKTRHIEARSAFLHWECEGIILEPHRFPLAPSHQHYWDGDIRKAEGVTEPAYVSGISRARHEEHIAK